MGHHAYELHEAAEVLLYRCVCELLDSYIDYRYALADETCNLVKCGNHAFMFNKVFKVALDVALTKRIKDGAEL